MARFLPDAIASIARQDRPATEVIIIDSGSTDETADVVKHHIKEGIPIRFIEHERGGPGTIRNVGLAVARCEIIAFLDADDLWPEGKLRRQLDYLDAFGTKGMVSGFVRYFDVLDPVTLAPADNARTETIFNVHLGACVYRRWVFDRIGIFDESQHYSEDFDFMLRVREAGIDFTILRAVTLYYRKHAASMTTQAYSRRLADFHHAVARSIARRRAGGMQASDLKLFESYLEPTQ